MKLVTWIAAAALLTTACGSRTGQQTQRISPGTSPSQPQQTASPVPSPSPSPRRMVVFLPSPNAAIPTQPGRLSRTLQATTNALRRSVTRWTGRGGTFDKPPRAVVLQALYQQRIYRVLIRAPKLARATIRRLSMSLRIDAAANVEAGAKLLSLVTPIRHAPAFKTGSPEPAGRLLRWFKEAERRFGVSWRVLAAVMYVESKFGRVRATSTAGAQGPMQFLPSTWARYGMGGDIHDPHDAVAGAANYLHASGAPADYKRALFRYNPSSKYVDAVLLLARQMRRDTRNYFAYYNWQVFVATTKGDERLTGPGL